MKVIIANIGGHIWFRRGNTPDHQEIHRHVIVEVGNSTYKAWVKLWDGDKLKKNRLQRQLKEYFN